MKHWLIGILLSAAGTTAAYPQDSLPPWKGGQTVSIGQPSKTRWHLGATIGADWRADQEIGPVGYGLLGVTHPLGNPVAAPLAFSAEAYAGGRSARLDGGARALLQIPYLRLSFGLDYNLATPHSSFIAGYSTTVRRGGVFGGGSLLRAEWNGEAVRASVIVPFRQPTAGRTRARSDKVEIAVRNVPPSLASPDDPELLRALAEARIAARRMGELIVPYVDGGESDYRASLTPLLESLRAPVALPAVHGPGVQTDEVVKAFHLAVEHAFRLAAGSDAAQPRAQAAAPLSDSARTILLEHVLYPYNSLLGQKKDERVLSTLATYARGNFARALLADSVATSQTEAGLFYVFEQVLDMVLELERRQRRLWHDSRLVWLPLQLGLRPADHDTQAELDAIIEAATGASFTNGNRVWYLVNEEFQKEVTQSIRDTRDYHVLWVHDFRGRNAEGRPDALSMHVVVDDYLHALTRGVRAYDRTGRLPVFMIFIDEHYYRQNRASLWLDVLEDPLGTTPSLRSAAIDATVRASQRELRSAVEASRLLQAEAHQYGAAWLRNLVKVHVNVTNPADFSFWSRQVMPLIGVPDNVMRDHRKIVFYDISEANPYQGAAIYTGMGVGEHYGGARWEDRSIMVQGPAVLSLKKQARDLLQAHGFRPDEIPYALRARPLAAGYQDSVRAEIEARRLAGQRDQRAVELHNQTGFYDKQVSVAKATLYSLMPAGSVIKVPDSLWGDALFASLLTGSALRGCRVLIVAPSLAAAPSDGWPQMALTHALLARLIVLQQELGPELQLAGGMLKTGIYNPGIGTQDMGARLYAAYRNARRTAFLRRVFPVNDVVDSLLVRAEQMLPAAAASGGVRTGRVTMPRLHLKANFFATREGWDSLIARPEMVEALFAYAVYTASIDPEEFDAKAAATHHETASAPLMSAFRSSLAPEQRERVMYYLLIGSANADYRSMLLDGEASVLLSGWSGIAALIDFGLIINLSIWIDDLEMLDALIPRPDGFQRWVARWLRPLL